MPAITLFLAEIPSGYFADRLGRKKSILLGAVLELASVVVLYTATNYGLLLVAHILIGLGTAFISGADSALLYDTLLELEREKEYTRIDGKAKFFGEMAVILSASAGPPPNTRHV